MGVLEFLCDIRFHQSFVLPPDPALGRERPCRFSYADFGDPNSDAVVLFCGALMGTRLCYAPLDQLAAKHNVRIIHPDRPGIGGTDSVDLDHRIQIWLEMVPQLLNHLGVSCVSLASHSGGDVYLLNTMLTYPHLLHPVNPYVSFFAPWVHPSHSKVTTMRVTELLPAFMIGKFALLAKFVNENVMPVAELSTSFSQSIKVSRPRQSPLSSVPLNATTTEAQVSLDDIAEQNPQPALDNPDVVTELRKLITTFMFAESMDGISADAQLLMRKPRSTAWSGPSMDWSDIDYFVPFFAKLIDGDPRAKCQDRKWMIDAYHAENDDMVGEKGRQWFDDCWAPEEVSGSDMGSTISQDTQQACYKAYEYRSETVKGSDHDYLLDQSLGASELWLQRVRDSFLVPEDEIDAEEPVSSTPSFAGKTRRRSVRGGIDRAWCSMAKGLHRYP